MPKGCWLLRGCALLACRYRAKSSSPPALGSASPARGKPAPGSVRKLDTVADRVFSVASARRPVHCPLSHSRNLCAPNQARRAPDPRWSTSRWEFLVAACPACTPCRSLIEPFAAVLSRLCAPGQHELAPAHRSGRVDGRGRLLALRGRHGPLLQAQAERGEHLLRRERAPPRRPRAARARAPARHRPGPSSPPAAALPYNQPRRPSRSRRSSTSPRSRAPRTRARSPRGCARTAPTSAPTTRPSRAARPRS